jgi:hypothetical protein
VQPLLADAGHADSLEKETQLLADRIFLEVMECTLVDA